MYRIFLAVFCKEIIEPDHYQITESDNYIVLSTMYVTNYNNKESKNFLSNVKKPIQICDIVLL